MASAQFSARILANPLSRPLISVSHGYRLSGLVSRIPCNATRRLGLERLASTTAVEKIDWLIIMPDLENALAKRMAVRPQHLEALKPAVEAGFWKMGGAILEEEPQEGVRLKIVGSCMMAHAATKEEVVEVLKGDIYFKANVWDFEKVQIYPFKTAFIKP